MRNTKFEIQSTKQYSKSKLLNDQNCFYQVRLGFEHLNFCHLNLFRISIFGFRIFLCIFAFLTFQPPAYAQFLRYPIPELGNCRDARECYLYCQIPKNTPACWSYGKYILYPNVLGENEVNITYPIPELGGCDSAQDCFLYCSQPANQAACTNYAKEKGLIKEQDPTDTSPAPAVMKAAKTELGCSDRDSCMAYCNLSANFEKCRNFAQKYGLEKQTPHQTGGPSPKVIEAAKTELGCSSEQSCRMICDKKENWDRCLQFAKKYGLEKKETDQSETNKQQILQNAQNELGCNSPQSCASFCEQRENMDKCMSFIKKYNPSPPVPGGTGTINGKPPDLPSPPASGNMQTQPLQTIQEQLSKPSQQQTQSQGPGGCTTEGECKEYCQKHPDECPGFPEKQEQQPYGFPKPNQIIPEVSRQSLPVQNLTPSPLPQ